MNVECYKLGNSVKSIIKNELNKSDVISFFKVFYSFTKFEKLNGRRDIDIPIYIYASGNDKTQSLSDKAKYEKLFPNSEWILLPNQIHSIYLEKPEYFCKIIESRLLETEVNIM